MPAITGKYYDADRNSLPDSTGAFFVGVDKGSGKIAYDRYSAPQLTSESQATQDVEIAGNKAAVVAAAPASVVTEINKVPDSRWTPAMLDQLHVMLEGIDNASTSPQGTPINQVDLISVANAARSADAENVAVESAVGGATGGSESIELPPAVLVLRALEQSAKSGGPVIESDTAKDVVAVEPSPKQDAVETKPAFKPQFPVATVAEISATFPPSGTKLAAQYGSGGSGSSPSLPIQLPNPLDCLLYTSPSPRDRTRSRMPSSA